LSYRPNLIASGKKIGVKLRFTPRWVKTLFD